MAGADDYIGKTVAKKYRVEAMIGEGGMGRVYKAIQLMLDKPVVLKVLRQALLSDERTVARFQREAKAASRLNHPNSISVLDFGQADDGALFIAMEYVAGKDLHHILSREWPLPESRVVRIVGQVLSALADAHGAGVIHRDLKPENIMVEQRRGEPDFVKVLDFGIAKITDSDDDGPALTRAGFVCGTPEYMSPEQARGAQLDHRSDLYAVGVILYQLTTGLLPFDSDSAVGFATKHLTEQPLTPSKRRPDARISPQMERLIMKSLAKSPDDRPQTAEQFRAELQAIDKERRATAPQRRGSPSSTSRPRLTPPEDVATRITSSPNANPWQVEATMRADAPQARALIANAQRDARPPPSSVLVSTAISEPPELTTRADRNDRLDRSDRAGRDRPDRDRERTERPDRTLPNGPSRRAHHTGVENTDKVKMKRGGGAGLAFKVITVILVCAAMAVAGVFFYQAMFQKPETAKHDGHSSNDEVYVPPPNAPVRISDSASGADDPKLFEANVPKEKRDVGGAARFTSEGDRAWARGERDEAIGKYRSAFALDPDPQTALKLGELYLSKSDREQAKAWFARHKRDLPGSKALEYISEVN